MLKLYHDYGTIPMSEAVAIMACDYDGDFMKAGKIWGICVYCGLLGEAK